MRSSLEARFWAKVVKGESPDDCWRWVGAMTRGYGRFGHDGRSKLAHRVSWFLCYGVEPPLDAVVMHKCDNGACVNPKHLAIGTQKDNLQDMFTKGRNSNVSMPGEASGTHKLSEAEVLEIRSLRGVPQRELAAQFGISQSLVHLVQSRKAWKHLP